MRVAHAQGMPGTFSPPPAVRDLDHGTCVTHVPWCMPGSLISGFRWSPWRGNVPGIPSACATCNFAYLVRGPWQLMTQGIIFQVYWPSSSVILRVYKFDLMKYTLFVVFNPLYTFLSTYISASHNMIIPGFPFFLFARLNLCFIVVKYYCILLFLDINLTISIGKCEQYFQCIKSIVSILCGGPLQMAIL